jgi:peptide/nickel transport system ATP-binding protein/glutathione transport system ATP-binding protein
VFTVDATQVPSLVRPKGYEPPTAQWREAGPDHRVRLETA